MMFVKEKLWNLNQAQGEIPAQGGAPREAGDWSVDLLRLVVERELTGRQRQCVELYYFQGMTMEAVGQQLGLNKATVCRHLQKARGRIKRVMGYAGWVRARLRQESREE